MLLRAQSSTLAATHILPAPPPPQPPISRRLCQSAAFSFVRIVPQILIKRENFFFLMFLALFIFNNAALISLIEIKKKG